MPAMNSALYIYIYIYTSIYIVVHITIIYIYYIIYIYIYYIYIYYIIVFIVVFVNSLCFSKNAYLILNKHERNFKLQILHVLKGVLSASYHAVHECFSKKEHVQIEHARLQKIA